MTTNTMTEGAYLISAIWLRVWNAERDVLLAIDEIASVVKFDKTVAIRLRGDRRGDEGEDADPPRRARLLDETYWKGPPRLRDLRREPATFKRVSRG